MTTWELNMRVDELLDVYSHIFDSYWDTKKIPEGHEYDALARYIKSVLDDPCTRYQGEMDALWLGLMKESLMEFFRVLLPYYIEIEEQQCRERKYMDKFFTGDLDKKRTMWRDVVDFIEEHYTPNEVNMDGYDHLLRNTDKNKDDIFDCLEQEWGNALDGEVRAKQEKLIENNRKSFEIKVRQLAGTKDYKKRKELKTYLRRYPILDEIVKMIGREKEAKTIERDDVITKYLPLLMKHSPIRESIDGVVTGDDISAVLPTEIALLADKKVEGLFYQRYATKNLQLFSGKSKLLAKEKKRIEKLEKEKKKLEKKASSTKAKKVKKTESTSSAGADVRSAAVPDEITEQEDVAEVESTPAGATPKSEIYAFVRRLFTSSGKSVLDSGDITKKIYQRYPDFDYRIYGAKKSYQFFEGELFEVVKCESSNVNIKLKD